MMSPFGGSWGAAALIGVVLLVGWKVGSDELTRWVDWVSLLIVAEATAASAVVHLAAQGQRLRRLAE